VDSRIKGRKN